MDRARLKNWPITKIEKRKEYYHDKLSAPQLNRKKKEKKKMEIFIRREEDRFFLSFERYDSNDIVVVLDIPSDSRSVISVFKEMQNLMHEDKAVSLEILMAECFRLGRIFR